MSLLTEIEKKSRDEISLFCLLSAERTLGAYESFAKKNSIDQKQIFNAYKIALNVFPDQQKEKLYELKKGIKNLIPDSEEYGDALADQAQCTVICMMYAIEFIISGDNLMAFYAIQKIDELIDIYTMENGDNKKLSQKEKTWRRILLKEISKNKRWSDSEINRLRNLNKKYYIPSV